MIAVLKKNINLVSVAEGSGVEGKRHGRRYVAPCPFHAERTPSFYIFDDNHFKCFGCGEHGDVIDFVQKLHGLPFKEALKFLGIEQGRMTPKMKAEIEQRKRRAELIKDFQKWCGDYGAWLGAMIIRTEKLMRGITPEDLDLYASLLHGL